MKARKILAKVLAGSRNIRFDEFRVLLEAFGFSLDRVSGSHHIYYHPTVPRAFPIQSVHGKAKPYQVRQMIEMIEQYNLSLEDATNYDAEDR